MLKDNHKTLQIKTILNYHFEILNWQIWKGCGETSTCVDFRRKHRNIHDTWREICNISQNSYAFALGLRNFTSVLFKKRSVQGYTCITYIHSHYESIYKNKKLETN